MNQVQTFYKDFLFKKQKPKSDSKISLRMFPISNFISNKSIFNFSFGRFTRIKWASIEH